jgi:hypothetical protein
LKSSISCDQHEVAKFYLFLSPAPPAVDLHIKRKHLTHMYCQTITAKRKLQLLSPECTRHDLGEAKEANEQQAIES